MVDIGDIVSFERKIGVVIRRDAVGPSWNKKPACEVHFSGSSNGQNRTRNYWCFEEDLEVIPQETIFIEDGRDAANHG